MVATLALVFAPGLVAGDDAEHTADLSAAVLAPTLETVGTAVPAKPVTTWTKVIPLITAAAALVLVGLRTAGPGPGETIQRDWPELRSRRPQRRGPPILLV